LQPPFQKLKSRQQITNMGNPRPTKLAEKFDTVVVEELCMPRQDDIANVPRLNPF
jgi:hypothetical protein